MMAMSDYSGVLTALILSSLSSVKYVWRGSNITDCSMKCPSNDGYLELYRECGENRSSLLKLTCNDLHVNNHYEPRLHYNTSTGCWTLTDAGKDDSCVYNIPFYGNGPRNLTLPITVLGPGWCSSLPGQCAGIVGGVVVVVVILIIIILLVKIFRQRRRTGESKQKKQEYEETPQTDEGTEMMDVTPV